MKNAEIKNTLSQISSSLEALEKGFQIVKIEEVKKGDFFKRLRKGEPSSKVYAKGGFDRFEKKYIGEDWDDISREIYLKKGTLVAVGFDF
tara:strand:+ start:198 stop:467 length:270 start_codon:yes stop_codon:yes gene_type:complete